MIVAATGHRPNKLWRHGFGPDPRLGDDLAQFAAHALKKLGPAEVISGMALGWDTAVARAAVQLGIPFTAAVPFEGQARTWPGRTQEDYRILLSLAARVVIVCPYALDIAYQERNEWMVDRCDRLLALWNGTPGGTANCIHYADRWLVPYDNVWDEWRSTYEQRSA